MNIAKLSNKKSVIRSDYRKAKDKFNNQGINQLFDILSTEAKIEFRGKKKKQVSKSNTDKQANLTDEIFDYIYIAKY